MKQSIFENIAFSLLIITLVGGAYLAFAIEPKFFFISIMGYGITMGLIGITSAILSNKNL